MSRSCGGCRWRMLLTVGLVLIGAAGFVGLTGCVEGRSDRPGIRSSHSDRSDAGAVNQSAVNQSAVATAHPLATAAAARILQQGGNAVDAAVAASFMLATVRPQSTGIGGGGFLVLFDPSRREGNSAGTSSNDGAVYAYDFRESAPNAASPQWYQRKTVSVEQCTFERPSVDGPFAVAVPGLVQGLVAVHARHGRMPFRELVQPAIAVAEEGFPVYPSLQEAIIARKDVLACFPASRSIFLNNGVPRAVGEVLRQRELAQTLRFIADHPDTAFREGPIVEAMVRDLQLYGAEITEQDFLDYTVVPRSPLRMSFQAGEFISFPPPSSGGIHLFQMLALVDENEESRPLTGMDDVDRYDFIARVMKVAFRDRSRYLGDLPKGDELFRRLTNRAYLRHSFEEISSSNQPLLSPREESPETTHFSIVDATGMAVSSTQTINTHFGSGMVSGSTGIVLNNEMDDFWTGAPNAFGLVTAGPNEVAPRKRPLSSMTPTIVLGRDTAGKAFPRLVVGSPGGPRIISATFQTVINYLWRGMPLEAAVADPRLHHQWMPDILYLEDSRATVIEGLKNRGYRVDKGSMYFGDVQAIAREVDGSLTAVSDARMDGSSWVGRAAQTAEH